MTNYNETYLNVFIPFFIKIKNSDGIAYTEYAYFNPLS